jgi:hypothetical protein
VERIRDLADYYTRPDWVRRVNAMGDSVGGAHHLISLDPDELVETARVSTGLSDFGDFDGDWRARLHALCASLENDAKLNTVGRLMIRQELLRGLCTRLRLTKARADEPAIGDETIEAPMIITGPARSGTSILFELVALDPNARGVLATEAAHPVPAGDPSLDELVAMTEPEQEFWVDVQPEISTIHDFGSDLPVECVTITIPSFSGGHWFMVADVASWVPDFAATMQYHKALLQTLQHGCDPKTWVVKTPVYMMMLDIAFDAYPDAWILHTHRDPLKTAPSGLSTLATVRWERSDHVTLEGAGDGTASMLTHVMDRRASGELPDRFVDLHFADLMADPAKTIGEAYARMGREFLPEHAEAIREYVANKPKDRHGRHRYSPEMWGIDPAELRAATRGVHGPLRRGARGLREARATGDRYPVAE